MRILIINSSPDTADMLEEFFLIQGWTTAVCPLKPLREGTLTGGGLMTMYRPDAIVLDVAIPYEANWSIVQRRAQSQSSDDEPSDGTPRE